MELAFKAPEESGWRGRGAPRREVPDHILEVLRRARTTGEVGVIDTSGDTPEAISEAQRILRAGGRQLGSRVRIQVDPEHDQIRFRVGDTP